MQKHAFLGVTLLILASVTGAPSAAPITYQLDGLPLEQHAALGRWDIVVHDPSGDYPSWLEITNTGDGNLTGRFVGRAGNARPVGEIRIEQGRVRFALAPQYEARMGVLRFLGTLQDDRMSGQTTNDQGDLVEWTAVRAPTLERERPARWGEPIELVTPHSLEGWRARGGDEMCWQADDGTLSTSGPCTDLITERKFKDFKLTLEFMVPHGGDSGVHLRGRYEIQLKDDAGGTPEEESGRTGGLFGFLPPLKQAGRAPGEWQTLEATLVGRTLTVVLNGETVIDAQQVPGITGDALDSDEAAAGPIMLQGYLGPVSYRNIVITPAVYEL